MGLNRGVMCDTDYTGVLWTEEHKRVLTPTATPAPERGGGLNAGHGRHPGWGSSFHARHLLDTVHHPLIQVEPGIALPPPNIVVILPIDFLPVKTLPSMLF